MMLDDPATFVDRGAAEFLDEPPALLAGWRAGRAALNEALAAVPDGHKIPWYGTAMSAVSMATARIMETWAHGLDIAEALDISRGADRPAAAHRPPRTSHLRPLLPGPRPGRPGRAGPAPADRARRFLVDVRPGRRGRPGDRVGPGLLPAGDAAAAPGRPRPGRRGFGGRPSGSTWPRRSPARRAPDASRRRWPRERGRVRRPADRQRLGLLRRPVQRVAGDDRGRPARRADR